MILSFIISVIALATEPSTASRRFRNYPATEPSTNGAYARTEDEYTIMLTVPCQDATLCAAL